MDDDVKDSEIKEFIANSDAVLHLLMKVCKEGPGQGLNILMHALVRLAKSSYPDPEDYDKFVELCVFLLKNVDDIEGNK